MIKLTATILGATLALGTMSVAAAQDAPKADAGATAKRKVADPDERICKPGKPTGTRLVTKVCKTRAEWAAADAANRASFDNSMRRSQQQQSGF